MEPLSPSTSSAHGRSDDSTDPALVLAAPELRRRRASLREALNRHPQDVQALEELGHILLEDEAFDETIAIAERCLAEVPGHAECLDLRRMAKGRSGRLDASEHERCYSTRPRDFGCIQGLAQARIQQGRYREARKLIDEMRGLDPSNALVFTMEGMLAQSEGDRDAARAKYEAACSSGQEYACKVAWELRVQR